jgi:hypothetical protein
MDKYRIVLDKRISSCFASFSSNDVILYKEVAAVPRDLPVKEVLLDKVAKVKILYLAPDETFSERGLRDMRLGLGHQSYNKTPEYIALVGRYKADGWVERIDWLEKANDARYERDRIAREDKRKRLGYLFWHDDYKRLKPDDYQGGFSDDLVASRHLFDYIRSGGCFGYIGHSCRKVKIDAYIEKQFMALKPNFDISRDEMLRLLGGWLTSTDGRHFGDALDDQGAFNKQAALIRQNITRMFNLAFIYALPEHAGTWKSTEELREKHKDKLFTDEGRY